MNACPPELRRHPAVLSGGAFRRPLQYTFTALLIWLDRARQRRHLARLDDRMLRDIGLDRASIGQEIAKPFWRP